LLLQREPRRAWSVDALVRELRGSAQLVQEGAAILLDAGLMAVAAGGEYIFEPKSAEVAALVSALAELYAQKPFAVLRAIFASPSEKIRSFSDAFRFKKSTDP
jgi:hypothetical protein